MELIPLPTPYQPQFAMPHKKIYIQGYSYAEIETTALPPR